MYKLVNSRGIPLCAFHGGDLDIRGIFPCRADNYMVFATKNEARAKLDYMLEEVIKDEKRIGFEMVQKMVDFINKLKIV